MAVYIILLALIIFLFFKLSKAERFNKDLRSLLRETEYCLGKQTEIGSTEKAKLEAVLSSMIEGVLVVDKKREIALVNPSLKNTLAIELPPEGKRPLEVISNSSIHDLVCKTLKEQKFISEEIFFTVPEEKSFLINSVPILKDKTLEGAILVFHDITELKRLEKIRSEFVANVSHELRTPLSSIKGYAETLLDGAIEDKKNARDFIEIIYHDSKHLEDLINDLLDLAKIESGKLKMVFAPVDISVVAKNAVAILESQAKSRGERSFVPLISIEIPSNLPKVSADDKRLSQVFLNLLDNAVKYTREKGTARISAYPKGNFIQVDITDSGIGIPEEDIPRIFERFYRVDKARSKEFGGTGLGLSIVKHIVQAHGGEIWIKSTLGCGSTFSFTIPKV